MSINLGLSSAGVFPEKGVLPRLANIENIKVAAISDKSSIGRMNMLAEKFSIPKKYREYADMLNDAELNAIYVCSPNVFHKDMVIAAAKAKKHIICEKPLGLNAEECSQMVNICKENNVKLGVNFCYLQTGAQQKVKQIIDDGLLGDISHIHISFNLCNFTKKVAGWRCDPKISGGGPLMDLFPHLASLASFLLDDKVKSVMAYVTPEKNNEQVEDDSLSILEFQKGAKVSIDASFKRCREHNYTIIGEKGSILANGTMGWLPGGKIFLQTLTDDFHNQEILYNQDLGIEHHFRKFAEFVEEGTLFFATGELGFHIQSVIDAVYESGRTGRKIMID